MLSSLPVASVSFLESPVESELFARARQGDSAAFRSLLGPLIPSLRRVASAYAGSGGDADDLVQEALVKASRSLDSFEGRASLATWLYAITRRVCLDWYRGRAFRQGRMTEDLRESVPAFGPAGDDAVVDRELSKELSVAVQSLEPQFRSVLLLCDVEGLSYAEVAEIEGVPVGTVRSRLSRARGKLRQQVGEIHPSLVPSVRMTGERARPESEPCESLSPHSP